MLNQLKKSARKFLQTRRAMAPYRHWTRELQSDPMFDLRNVDRGFLPRPTGPERSADQRAAIAERVIEAYRQAVADQAGQSAVYKVSNEWVPIFNKPLRPLLAALQKGDPSELSHLLDNFFRSTVAEGLCGLATDMAGTYFDRQPSNFERQQFLIDALYRVRLLEQLMPGTTVADLQVDDVGNPYGMYFGEHFVRTGADYQYYYASRVADLLPAGVPGVVAELGGGIGGFAYFLLKNRAPTPRYINLDLPEILCISSYQLLNLFPERSAVLYGEIDTIDSQTLAPFDIALLPSYCVENLDVDSVDVSFNSYSLAEMDLATITNYTGHLSRVTREAILHVNHVAQALVGADSFPFDMQRFEQVERKQALWNLGRNLQCDEHEFLLKRRSA